MSIHFTNLPAPKSFQDFLAMNTKGKTSTLGERFPGSTGRSPWAGNSPGQAGSYGATKHLEDVFCDDYDEM
jgi:hypothetical protein